MSDRIPESVLRDALAKVIGEPQILESDVDWDLKHPCGDCPFLRTSPFHSGVAKSLKAYVESMRGGTFLHTCHKTDNRQGCDGPRNWGGRPKHCAGAILMLFKSGGTAWLQAPFIRAIDDGKVDVAALAIQAKADRRVFTLRGLLGFYLRHATKLLAKGRSCKTRRKPSDA